MKKQVTIKGIDLSYHEFGKGNPLLFLHGGRLRAQIFIKTLNELSKNYYVIVPDIPGYGDSSTPKEPWSFGDYAEFFITLIEYLKIKEIIVVGYSLGGGIAYTITSMSKKVKKLILIDSAGIEKISDDELKRDINRLMFYLIHPWYFVTLFTLIKEWILFNLKHLLRKGDMNNIRINLGNSCQYLINIKVPTTIIWAKDDDIFPLKIAKKLKQSIKTSTLFIVKGNHDWILYDQKKFAEYLNKALR
ncbi:hypothetical protein A3H86_01770 [Candidatus Roizmanbacteria bacterium RIFCSPLOWO2_02_FULL_41_9]|uniref:AB hydrolase-1 domain-containing protein n=1 Tax=Candidatus Roizmanbacteria bacterium RIFCSPLOWO2_02_FULL_41_9 TaxID=1802077 RepID=A0A1F7JQE6_9BACT|nr:MAG: hypothetical protein A3H86_01770 [Candidatus Roizmanbacteria bacterium RIFCSPLOWO2_02_FULL_41_9]